jgi:glyoxylase-like metal-dependent hydrolase (beta-lactamase superfamily II)
MLIERVLAPNPGPMTGTGTNTYVVRSDGGRVAVIDPGPVEPSHLAAIRATAAPLGPIEVILVTHRHLDHLPAAIPLAAETGAPFTGHADLPDVQSAIADGDHPIDGLQAVFTPGHTRDSLCFWAPTDGALFTGDLVAGAGTVVLDDQPDALQDYLGSLERLRTLQPRTLYPGHGPVVQDAVGKLSEYLDHRRRRVQEVLDALATRDAATVDELVAAIYPDVSPRLVPMAARNVRANLDKLLADGLVDRRGEAFVRRPTQA